MVRVPILFRSDPAKWFDNLHDRTQVYDDQNISLKCKDVQAG